MSKRVDRVFKLLRGYTILSKIKLTPGTDDDGEVNVEKLISWVREARALLIELSREKIGDQSIGELLGRCSTGNDGVWPHPAVRVALERIGNGTIREGMALAVYNSRGVVFRGPGGDQERVLAEKYEGWGKALALEYKKPAGIRSFPPAALVGVIFGAKISDQHRQAIEQMIEARPGELKCFRAEVDKDAFKLNIIEEA